jgi:hypothetical protein
MTLEERIGWTGETKSKERSDIGGYSAIYTDTGRKDSSPEWGGFLWGRGVPNEKVKSVAAASHAVETLVSTGNRKNSILAFHLLDSFSSG